MNNFDDIRAILERMKGEPAPEYIHDITGIAHKAMEVRSQKRWRDWNGQEPFPMNDEIPY